MSGAIVLPVLVSAFVGAVLLLLPHFSSRRYFFSITVPPGFRNTDEAHAALGRYHATVALATAIAAVAIVLLTDALHNIIPALVPFAQMFGAFAAYLRERAGIKRLFPPSTPVPLVATLDAGHLPGWIVLAAPPFALPLAAAIYLKAHWDQIPARFAVHWGANGVPNGWSEKTVRGVYGPLLFAAGLMLLILMLGLAIYYGSRGGPMRRPTLAIMLSVMYVLGFAFTAAGLLPLVHFSPATFLVPFLAYMVIVLVWSYRISTAASGEATPDECWTLGGIYYNPEDPALFVQKRIGFGYTINFGNRLSWLFLGTFILGIIGLIFVAK